MLPPQEYTLEQIQAKVNEALTNIADRDCIQRKIWPNIRDMLTDCIDLRPIYRGEMRKLIYERLNNQPLHGTPVPINLQRLDTALQAGNVRAIEPKAAYKWLAW